MRAGVLQSSPAHRSVRGCRGRPIARQTPAPGGPTRYRTSSSRLDPGPIPMASSSPCNISIATMYSPAAEYRGTARRVAREARLHVGLADVVAVGVEARDRQRRRRVEHEERPVVGSSHANAIPTASPRSVTPISPCDRSSAMSASHRQTVAHLAVDRRDRRRDRREPLRSHAVTDCLGGPRHHRSSSTSVGRRLRIAVDGTGAGSGHGRLGDHRHAARVRRVVLPCPTSSLRRTAGRQHHGDQRRRSSGAPTRAHVRHATNDDHRPAGSAAGDASDTQCTPRRRRRSGLRGGR